MAEPSLCVCVGGGLNVQISSHRICTKNTYYEYILDNIFVCHQAINISPALLNRDITDPRGVTTFYYHKNYDLETTKTRHIYIYVESYK